MTRARTPFPRHLAVLFSVTCGLAVANVYYAQPLLDEIANAFEISHAFAGAIITFTQVGYALGLLLVVPLGDLLDRRRLVVGQLILTSLALTAVAFASGAWMLLAAMAIVGALAVVAQVLVAYAAILAEPSQRGRAVGTVTSGIVIGILLARVVSGTLSDLLGWRSVYIVSAIATLVMAALLLTVLPAHAQPGARMSYLRLIGSVFTIFAEERLLRIRAIHALLIFSAIATLLTPVVLPLTAPPFYLSHTQVGLLGLAGAAGALGANFAGAMGDRGHAQRATAVGLTVMLASWVPISLLSQSVWLLVIGVVIMDFGLQTVHVANQILIYRLRPEAQSRLAGAYMLFYSFGIGAGSIVSTLVYAWAGWGGVCAIGAAISATALAFWGLTRHSAPQTITPNGWR
jgi:predicted MFS family arabinose efflux permease